MGNVTLIGMPGSGKSTDPAAGGGAPPGDPGREGGPLFSGRGGACGALGGVRPARDRPRGQRGLPGGSHRPPEGRGPGDLPAGAPGGVEGPNPQSGLSGHRPGAGSDPGGHHGPPGPPAVPGQSTAQTVSSVLERLEQLVPGLTWHAPSPQGTVGRPRKEHVPEAE